MDVGWRAALLCAGGAAVMDLRSRRISNSYLLGWFLAGLSLADGKGCYEKASMGLGMILPFLLLFPLWRRRMLGAGDVKLLCLLGLLLGPERGMFCLWYSLIFGGLYSVFLLLFYGRFRPRFPFSFFCFWRGFFVRRGVSKAVREEDASWRQIPFSLPIFISVLYCARRTGGCL